MIHAIQSFDCTATAYDVDTEEKAKKKIDEALDNKYAVVVSVENSDHWAVLAARDDKRYYFIDSAEGELIGRCKWKEISSWLGNKNYKNSEVCYYFIVVKPKDKTLQHCITGKVNDLLKLWEEDETIINYWSYYLTDLLDVFDSPPDKKDSISSKEFFSKHGAMIYKVAAISYLYTDEDLLVYELQNYQTVAETHGLHLSRESELKAMLKMNSILTLLAAGID